MKKLIFIVQLMAATGVAQVTISPQVLNSAGQHTAIGSTGFYLTDNVGEPFTQSTGYNVASFMITEGFLQPEKTSIAGFSLNSISQSHQCLDKEDDAFISLAITSTISKYDVKYFWSDASICPNNDCSKVDTLKSGPYTVTVAIQYTTNVGIVKYDTLQQSFVITAATAPCKVKVFNGITPNNDNLNDFFTIENIKEFPTNRVSIYNRWGNLMADIDGYNPELSDKRWPRDSDLSQLQSTTYFYIIELGDGSKPIKGWLELIKD